MADAPDDHEANFPMLHRGYKINRDKQFGVFYATKVGKGPLPKSLDGTFQSMKMVIRLIDEFVDKVK